MVSVRDSKGTAEVDQNDQNRLSGEPDIGTTNNPRRDQETAGNTTATAPPCHPGRRPNGTFAPGRPSYPVKRLSIRQQRRIQYDALCKLNLETSRAIARGEKVSQVDFTRAIHLALLLEREL